MQNISLALVHMPGALINFLSFWWDAHWKEVPIRGGRSLNFSDFIQVANQKIEIICQTFYTERI